MLNSSTHLEIQRLERALDAENIDPNSCISSWNCHITPQLSRKPQNSLTKHTRSHEMAPEQSAHDRDLNSCHLVLGFGSEILSLYLNPRPLGPKPGSSRHKYSAPVPVVQPGSFKVRPITREEKPKLLISNPIAFAFRAVLECCKPGSLVGKSTQLPGHSRKCIETKIPSGKTSEKYPWSKANCDREPGGDAFSAGAKGGGAAPAPTHKASAENASPPASFARFASDRV